MQTTILPQIWINTRADYAGMAAGLVLSWATVVKGEPKAPFPIATTLLFWRGRYSFLWSAPLTFDPYLF